MFLCSARWLRKTEMVPCVMRRDDWMMVRVFFYQTRIYVCTLDKVAVRAIPCVWAWSGQGVVDGGVP